MLSRRSSASVADVAVPTMPSEAVSRRWSGSDAAAAARKFDTYDPAAAGVAQTSRKEVFEFNGSSSSISGSGRRSRSDSVRNNLNSNGGDGGGNKARSSFFPTPQNSTSRIHPGSEDEPSWPAATRPRPPPAYETSKFVESGDEEAADERAV